MYIKITHYKICKKTIHYEEREKNEEVFIGKCM